MNANPESDLTPPGGADAGIPSPPDACERLERPAYLDQRGEQLYTVLYPPASRRRGRVLLAGLGPFASYPARRQIPWIRWARFLARHGLEALRFDYRGTGESTGRLDDQGLDAWLDDVRRCVRWLREREPGGPLALHGLGLGALLASRAFAEGDGDALLLWLPPASARDLLYEFLKLRLAFDFTVSGGARRSRDDYIADLEAGRTVEVEGVPVSPRLWREAVAFEVEPPAGKAGAGPAARPRRTAELAAPAAGFLGGIGRLPSAPPDAGGGPQPLLSLDWTASFGDSCAWILQAIASRAGGGAPAPMADARVSRPRRSG
jgi:hypothetical protein